jgi:hypothetical protein
MKTPSSSAPANSAWAGHRYRWRIDHDAATVRPEILSSDVAQCPRCFQSWHDLGEAPLLHKLDACEAYFKRTLADTLDSALTIGGNDGRGSVATPVAMLAWLVRLAKLENVQLEYGWRADARRARTGDLQED